MILSAIIGGLLRVWWGGFLSPRALLKRAAVFAIAATIAIFFLPLIPALLVGAVMLGAFMNALHGEGMDLGDRYGSYWADVGVMAGSYGGYMLLLCSVVSISTGTALPLLGALGGFLVPLGYMAAKAAFDHFGLSTKKICWLPVTQNGTVSCFISGYTSFGELWLGVCLFGSMGVALWLV